jgi:hypothetical protein
LGVGWGVGPPPTPKPQPQSYNKRFNWYYIIIYYKKEINIINKYLLLRYLMGKQHGSLSRAGKVI